MDVTSSCPSSRMHSRRALSQSLMCTWGEEGNHAEESSEIAINLATSLSACLASTTVLLRTVSLRASARPESLVYSTAPRR